MNNVLIIVGSAPCALEDFASAIARLGSSCCHIMLIGLSSSGLIASDVNYIATYHPNDIPSIEKSRKEIGANTDYLIIGHKKREGVDIVEPYVAPSGSSALLGALAGIRMGYDKIILCGCPLIGVNKKAFRPYSEFQKGWKAKEKEVRPFVRSMSGWTKELLGEPTADWLNK